MHTLNFWVDIEDGAGRRVGSGPLRPFGYRQTKVLSASGEFSFEVSTADPNLAALSEKRVALCRYVDEAGVVQTLGGGVIDQIELKAAEDGTLLVAVSGNDLTRELTYRSVGELTLVSGGYGVTDGPTQIMGAAPAGWSILGGYTATPVYGALNGETVLNALVRCGEHIGEHWRLGAGREIVWLGAADAFASSGVRAIQHANNAVGFDANAEAAIITNLQEQRVAADVFTRVIPRGSGSGTAVVTLTAVSADPPAGYTLDKPGNYLRNDAAEETYGRIERVLDFKELGPVSNTAPDVQAAANMLLQAARQQLARAGAPQHYYSLDLAGLNRLVEPGETLRVIYRQQQDGFAVYDLDATLNIVEVDHAIDATGLWTTSVGVSNIDRRPPSDAEFQAAQAQSAKVFSAYPQLNANGYVTGYREPMDAGKPARLDFWLGEEVTQVNQVKLRFRVDPLRSTVKSITSPTTTSSSGGDSTQTSSSGGDSTQTSSSGGGATATSAAGGATTVSASDHQHYANIFQGTSGTQLYFHRSSGIFYADMGLGGGGYEQASLTFSGGHQHSVPDHTHSVTVPAHTHSVTIPAHTHSVTIPSHTHTVTTPIQTVYGIYEESSGNTLAETDLVYAVNGGSALGRAVDIGSGWYELDLTTGVSDPDSFRPTRATNQVTISTSTPTKTCTITAQLVVRTIIQAVALV